jgi:hypothetical protein
VAVIPEPVTIYRWHKDNLSQIPSWERLQSYWNVSLNAIKKSKPARRRVWLLARSWSNFTYHRAGYAMRYAYPRWLQVWYAGTAFLVYPFEMTREKLGALVRSLLGDYIYRNGKRAIHSRLQARGPE